MRIKKLKQSKYSVESSAKGKFYTVDLAAPSCTCAHFAFRLRGTGEKCKHISAVEKRHGNRKSRKKGANQKSLASYSRIMEEVRRSSAVEAVVLMEKYGSDEVQKLIDSGELIEKKGKLMALE